GKPAPLLWVTGLFERDLNFFLRIMETNIAFAALPPPSSLVLTNFAEQFGQTANRNHCIVSAMLLPALSRVIVGDAATHARIRLARTAMGVESFRLTNKRLPENL